MRTTIKTTKQYNAGVIERFQMLEWNVWVSANLCN